MPHSNFVCISSEFGAIGVDWILDLMNLLMNNGIYIMSINPPTHILVYIGSNYGGYFYSSAVKRIIKGFYFNFDSSRFCKIRSNRFFNQVISEDSFELLC